MTKKMVIFNFLLFVILCTPLKIYSFRNDCASNPHYKLENYSERYFVAVITFLFSDICCLIGRIIASVLKQRPSETSLAVVALIRMIVFIPLFMFCNALPRSHLSVWFPHDWQYIIILGSFMMSSGYLFNIAFLNIIRLAPEHQENSYLIMQTCIGVVGAVFSPLGILCVHLL